MSKYKDGSYGSVTGIALLAKVLAGRCTIKYTKAVVGSGYVPDDMTPKTMTGPADYVMDARIVAVTNPVDGECQVTIQVKSDDVAIGFYATNIVLYAEDPDVGEVPYTYLLLENEPEWIRPASSIVGKLATFDLIAAVGDVDTVAACIDPEAIATVGKVEQMIADSVGTRHFDVVIEAEQWQRNGDEWIVDVEMPKVTEGSYLSIVLRPDSLQTAYDAGLSPTVQSLDGFVRFWSYQKPSSDINATVAVFFKVSDIINIIPIATNTTLGGVRVQRDSGLVIDSSGNLSIDNGTSEDIEELFDN